MHLFHLYGLSPICTLIHMQSGVYLSDVLECILIDAGIVVNTELLHVHFPLLLFQEALVAFVWLFPGMHSITYERGHIVPF